LPGAVLPNVSGTSYFSRQGGLQRDFPADATIATFTFHGSGMSFKDIKNRFGASFQRGDRVFCEGRFGTVASANHKHVRVRFDGKWISAPCEPRDLQLVGPAVFPSTTPATAALQ